MRNLIYTVMDRTWIWLVRVLFQISFLIGVSYFRKGKYLVLDGIVFCISTIWFGTCTIRLELDSLVFGGTYETFRLFVIFWSLFSVNMILFLSFIDFRLKNNLYCRLISLQHKLNTIHSLSRARRSNRLLLNVFGVIAFQLLSGVLFLYWEENVSNVTNGIYDRLCTTTITWPTTVLCVQFSCWVQIFVFNFELVLEKIRSAMISAKQTDISGISHCRVSKLKSELKMVMRLKKAITDSYGSSIIFNQLYTFICLLLNCTLLSYAEFGISRVKPMGWSRYYFLTRILYYSVLSYIPHRIGQIAFSEVSWLLD